MHMKIQCEMAAADVLSAENNNPYFCSAKTYLQRICQHEEVLDVRVTERKSKSRKEPGEKVDQVSKRTPQPLKNAQQKVDHFFYNTRHDAPIRAALSSLYGYEKEANFIEQALIKGSALEKFMREQELPGICLLDRPGKMRGIKITEDWDKESIVGIYTGHVKPLEMKDSGLYTVDSTVKKDGVPTDVVIDALDFSEMAEQLNAKDFGANSHINMMGLVQHGCPGADNVKLVLKEISSRSSKHTYSLSIPLLISKRDLKKDEELLFDYGFNFFSINPDLIITEGYKNVTECLCPLHSIKDYKSKYPWFLPVAGGVNTSRKVVEMTSEQAKHIKRKTKDQYDEMVRDQVYWRERLMQAKLRQELHEGALV